MIEKESYVWGEIEDTQHEYKFSRAVKSECPELNVTSDTDRDIVNQLDISTDRMPWDFDSSNEHSFVYEILPNSIKMEKISMLALPTIASLFIQKMQEVINLSMLGHQKHLQSADMMAQLNGVGLGNMTINLLGLSIIYGANSTIETLSS